MDGYVLHLKLIEAGMLGHQHPFEGSCGYQRRLLSSNTMDTNTNVDSRCNEGKSFMNCFSLVHSGRGPREIVTAKTVNQITHDLFGMTEEIRSLFDPPQFGHGSEREALPLDA